MHACIHAGACVDRRSIVVSNWSAVALHFFQALSCLLSSWSSLLTVALCYLHESWCLSRQRAKLFKKVCLFLGVGGGLAVLSMAPAFSEHSLWPICKRCSSCVVEQKPFFSWPFWKRMKLRIRSSWRGESEWVSDEWHLVGVGKRESEREREREREREIERER